jgi:hypothetical protein
MSLSLFSLEQTAARLSVSTATLNWWHQMRWAAATNAAIDYEEVFVPRVGNGVELGVTILPKIAASVMEG